MVMWNVHNNSFAPKIKGCMCVCQEWIRVSNGWVVRELEINVIKPTDLGLS